MIKIDKRRQNMMMVTSWVKRRWFLKKRRGFKKLFVRKWHICWNNQRKWWATMVGLRNRQELRSKKIGDLVFSTRNGTYLRGSGYWSENGARVHQARQAWHETYLHSVKKHHFHSTAADETSRSGGYRRCDAIRKKTRSVGCYIAENELRVVVVATTVWCYS